MKIYSIYDVPEDVGIEFTEETMTQQQFKDESDTNFIVGQFVKTGVLPNVNMNPSYMDLSNVPSYRDALEFIAHAEDSFMALPALVRQEFDNDPGLFLDFVDNPDNYSRCQELGIFPPSDPPLLDVNGRTDTNQFSGGGSSSSSEMKNV